MERSAHLSFTDMGKHAPGCAYLESVQVVDQATHVRLRYSTGAIVDATLPVTPRRAACDPLDKHSVLAVHVRQSRTLECVALLTAGHEERRLPITLQQAMTLAQDGVHTVFMTEGDRDLVPPSVATLA